MAELEDLLSLCEALQTGRLTPAQALPAIASWAGVQATAEVAIDLQRAARCGYPEVVYSPGKSVAAIIDVFQAQRAQQQPSLATRITAEQADAVRGVFPQAEHNPLARTLRLGGGPAEGAPFVAIVTAGTSDRPVAEEAAETARWMGCEADVILDVGVAGPQRLPLQLPRLARARALVVVAGMEAALPSVVAGYVACPVIGVPTSQGYGAHFQGVAALLSMLNSCAANVAVVNIDAGFKGGYLAGVIARQSAARPVTAVDSLGDKA